jgi:hypothetical protein
MEQKKFHPRGDHAPLSPSLGTPLSEMHTTTLAVFIDFSKAFDSLWRERLLHKLRKKGITGNTIADFMS